LVSPKKHFIDNNTNYFIDKFNQANKENRGYYKAFLKEMFFNGLCKKKNERSDTIKKLVGDIPYLNGGLFIESDIELKYGNAIEIDNKAFYKPMQYPIEKGEKNVPVLNLLDCKEWTIDERSGEVDKLNPEVLGYIFEKSINQKDLGAVYTPEEVTTYICKSTIYPYLIDKINEKFNAKFEYMGDIEKDLLKSLNKEQAKHLYDAVKELRILDPAVGSGHFLVDAIITLEKVYYFLRDKEIIDWNNFEIREHIITENLFGVDILPGAIEICKLRMFLSLAETFETEKDIHPLPNIEFNFRAGNSLIGFTSKKDIQQQFFSNGEAINTLSKHMRFLRKHSPEVAKQAERVLSTLGSVDPSILFKIRTDLVKIYRTLHKHELQTEFRTVLNEITEAFDKELNSQFYERNKNAFENDRQKINKFKEFSPFYWIMEYSEVMEKDGFDIIIGNPPYGAIRNIFDDGITKLLYGKLFKENYNLQIGNYNLYKVFIERAYYLLQKGGYFGFIFPSSFLGEEWSGELRKHIFKKPKC